MALLSINKNATAAHTTADGCRSARAATTAELPVRDVSTFGRLRTYFVIKNRQIAAVRLLNASTCQPVSSLLVSGPIFFFFSYFYVLLDCKNDAKVCAGTL